MERDTIQNIKVKEVDISGNFFIYFRGTKRAGNFTREKKTY
jgi:hypothetical protein